MAKEGVELYEEIYDIMNLRLGSQSLSSWADLAKEAGKQRQWVYQGYIPWLKKEHPGKFEDVEKIMEYGKQMGIIQKRIPQMDQVLDQEIDAPMLMAMYKQEVVNQMKGNVAQKVKTMLDSMEDDLVTARAVTLQACMLAITGYFASIQKRVKEGKEIYTKEFKAAYEIYKTEMGEPVKIKETRHKTLQVTLNVPVSSDDVKHILGNQVRQDLSIEVADEFKSKLEDKFTIIEDTNAQYRGHQSEVGND